MLMVDDKAAADPDRRKLYQLLGVPVLTNSLIEEAIVNRHRSKDFKPDNLAPTVLVSHAEFIYKNDGGKTSLGNDLWVATYLGHCRKGNNTYRPDDNDPYSASRMLPKEPKQKYGFLHPAYLEAGRSQDSAWIEFLENKLDIWVIPRIGDLKFVMKQYPSQEWLKMLRDQRKVYENCVGISKLAEVIGSTEVVCTGSVIREQIRHTYAPFDHLTKDFGPVAPFIDIPEPEDPRWEPLLKLIGVKVEADFYFYLVSLRHAKKTGNGSVELIRRLMHELEQFSHSSKLA